MAENASSGQTLPDLKFSGAILTIASNIQINFKVDQALAEAARYTDLYVVYKMNGIHEVVHAGNAKNGMYSFPFQNLLAQWMTDTLTDTLYATYQGEVYCIQTREYSVSAYCYNLLNNLSAGTYSGEQYDRLRTLLLDFLHYGSAMQRYANYDTDAQANAKLTTEQLSYGSTTDRAPANVRNHEYAVIPNPSASILGVGLELMDSIHPVFVTNLKGPTGYRARIQCNDSELWINGNEFQYTTDITVWFLTD